MQYAQPTNSQLEIISVHIPKTAGSTFGQVLAEIYGNSQVLFDNPLLDSVNQLPAINPYIRAIHGHFPISKYVGCFPEVKRIVWLRHPIKRLLSHYFYLKSFSEVHNNDPIHRLVIEQQISVVEFAEQEGMFNVLSGFTNGLQLTDFYFVGIQEFFVDDLIDLKTILRWPGFGVGQFNLNPNREYNSKSSEVLADRKIVDKLTSILSQDIVVYQEALHLRAKRKARLN